MKRVVVTGGAGFIGSHLAKALLECGYETHIVDDLTDGKRERIPDGAIFHELDVRDTERLIDICREAEGVFHLAALPRVPYSIEQPAEAHSVNVNGTLSVLMAARDARAKKLIYTSSSAVYGDQPVLPLHEALPAIPMNPYGLHKLIGEYYCRMFSELYQLPTVSLRFFNVYGSGMDPEGSYALAIPRFLMLRSKGEPLTITGDGTQTRDFIHVADIASAYITALRQESIGKGETVNIGSGRNVSMNQLAELIGGERVYVPARAEARHMCADISCAKSLLDWEPRVALEEGIAALKKEWGL